MTVGVQGFRGRRLREARLSRGLYKNALADMVGVSGTAITRYEDGIDNPQYEKLSAIAAGLNFPIDFFLQPEWVESPDLVFWRSRAAETKLAREMTEQRMTWMCEVFAFLEREVDFPVEDIPVLNVPADFRMLSAEKIEQICEDLRAHWKLGDMPIRDVTLVLEKAGIPVVHLDIVSEKQDGFCFRSKQIGRVFVGININNVSSVRARYDAAHELGHIMLHRNVTAQQERDPALHKLIEQQAHRFAAAFLFPKSSFLREVGSPSLDYFCGLKRRWGMSIGAMVYRASDLHLIDKFDKETLFRNMTRRRWRGPLQEPFDNPVDMPLEQPRMLRRAVEAIVDGGVMDGVSIKSALSLPEREIAQIVSVEESTFNVSNVLPIELKNHGAVRVSDADSGVVLEFSRVKRR